MLNGEQKPKALIVHDTRENILVLMGTLKDQYAIVAAINGEKALKMAVAEPAPDLILPDIMMLGMDGFELCSRLKRILAEKNLELRVYSEGLEERAQRRTAELASLNNIYERFVPRESIDLLRKNTILEINLGDQVSRKMTVMFADIRGWTTLLEKMTPEEAFRFIST